MSADTLVFMEDLNMDIVKENEILRKRNKDLSKSLEEAKAEIERLKELNADVERDKVLADLKNIEKEWKEIVADLQKQRETYANLNRELAAFKNELCKKQKKSFLLKRK